MKRNLFRIIFAASITFLTPFTLTNASEPPRIAFVASEQAMPDPVSSVALGDVDGDGDLDAITIHPVQPGRVWLNAGTGVFEDSGQNLIDGSSVSLGDLNGDGSLDVFISRGGSGNGLPSEVWMNDGTGIFSNSGQRVNNKVAMDAALGDVDNDDDLDIVIANFHDTSGAAIPNEVWLNDGSGRFSDSGQRLGRSVTDGVELGDLDDDGDIDIVFANTRGSNEIWLNQGGVSGIFEVSDQPLDTGGTFRLGDLDNDGDLDVLQLKSGHDTGKVWLNDGTGVFDDNGQVLINPDNAGAWGIALNDLDRDGDLDAFVAYGGGRGLGELVNTANSILVNDGTGFFRDSNLRLGNADSQDVALGDLDGDGDSDAFVANLGGSDAANKVWFNESPVPVSSGVSFVDSHQPLGTINNWDVELIDLNDDGVLEAYFEGALWQNDGQGNFTKSDLSFGPPDKQAWFADVNNDGWIDAICDNVVFLNRGQNQFAEGVTIPSDIPMYYAQLADLNDDGAIDIITAAAYEDRILINDGLGNFTNTGQRLSGWEQCRYAVGDINGDGITDIYVSIPHTPPPDMGAASNLIWFGDGSGDFSEVQANTPVSESRTVVMADFDDDGDLDLFLASGVSASRVFVNNGKGEFTDSGQNINEGFHASDAQAGDLDQDGDLDLFIANGKPLDNGQPNTVWLNDGDGRFLDSGLRLGELNSLNVALGDLNEDSYLDAIIANVDITSNAAPVEIWFNVGQTTVEPETSGDTLGVWSESSHTIVLAQWERTLFYAPSRWDYVCHDAGWDFKNAYAIKMRSSHNRLWQIIGQHRS
jgi:hypothetical protein